MQSANIVHPVLLLCNRKTANSGFLKRRKVSPEDDNKTARRKKKAKNMYIISQQQQQCPQTEQTVQYQCVHK